MESVFQWLKRVLQKAVSMPGLVVATEERSRTIEFLLRLAEDRAIRIESLLVVAEERTKTNELLLHSAQDRAIRIESLLVVAEERTRTLEYVARQSLFAHNHQIDFLQKLYVEAIPRLPDLNARPGFNAAPFLELKTNYQIALGSNDHINPDSTTEGVSRPTLFVQDCIRLLGGHIKSLDLGSGAAGLVFEFAMNGILAVGVDGSDFCRINRVGYWPLLPGNLFTCDITKPFRFMAQGTSEVSKFEVVTMWEVLEHIGEKDLAAVLHNVDAHLTSTGYFMGSISLLEYVDASGTPYHVTLKPKPWWRDKFQECGLIMLDEHPFNERLFCRGNGPRFQDFHNYFANPHDGFHFVAQRIRLCESAFAPGTDSHQGDRD